MADNINAKNFVKNIIGFSMSTWVGFVISFFTIPIITRVFDPDAMGKINMYTTIVNLGMTVVLCGLDQTYTRFYYEGIHGKGNRLIFSYALIVTTVITLVAVLILLPFRQDIAYEVVGESKSIIFLCLAVSIYANAVLRLHNLNYRMRQDCIRFSIQALLIVVCTKVAYIVCAGWDTTYYSAVLFNSGLIFLLMIVYWFIQKEVRLPLKELVYDKEVGKVMMKFGLPLMPASIIAWLNSSISNLLIKQKLSFTDLGVYSSAMSIASLISLIQTGFNMYWTAFVYENYKKEHRKISAVHNYITYIMILFGMTILFFQDIIFLLLGESYRSSKNFFAFLLIAPICYTISESTGVGIAIAKKTQLNMIFIVGSLIVNVAGCYLLIPRVGSLGAAVASALAGFVYLAIRSVLGEKYYKCVTSYKRSIAALALMLAACMVNMYLSDRQWGRMGGIFLLMAVLTLLYAKEFMKLIKLGMGIVQDIWKQFGSSGNRN